MTEAAKLFEIRGTPRRTKTAGVPTASAYTYNPHVIDKICVVLSKGGGRGAGSRDN